ncbi:hypothetical protein ACOMHN_055413 [Nucella lapillus]
MMLAGRVLLIFFAAVCFASDETDRKDTRKDGAKLDRSPGLSDDNYDTLLNILARPVKDRARNHGDDILYRKKAVEAAKSGMSLGAASKKFGVPKTTIADRVSGKRGMTAKRGRKQDIPEDIEREVVIRALEASKRGFPLTKRWFLVQVARLVRKLNMKTRFKNGIPGQDYWLGLRRRFSSEVTLRMPEALQQSRMRMINREVVTQYFSELGELMSQLNVKAQNIWNCDETGLQFQHRPSKIMAAKGARMASARAANDKQSLTIMATISAAGEAMPPMLVAKGKMVKSLHAFATFDAPADAVWTFQDKGWMNDSLGVQWFEKVFLRHCGGERPQLLILNSHSSHEVMELLEKAKEEDICMCWFDGQEELEDNS